MTNTMESIAQRPAPAPMPGVIARTMDEGAVLFDGKTETYFGLNTVGAEVWAMLVPPYPTVGDICAQLQLRYPEAPMDVLLADVSALLADLVEGGLAAEATVTESSGATHAG